MKFFCFFFWIYPAFSLYSKKDNKHNLQKEDGEGEGGDETTGGDETSSSGSGVAKFKRLKLNHRYFILERDISSE